jgi:epoxyqueuosine reductase QueG
MSADLKKALLERCERMEIPLVGIASVERWNDPPFLPWMPEEFYPQSIYPKARSAIVRLPITLPVLETSPSIYYRELYHTVNSLLDQHTYRLANFLNERGYPSLFVPRDGYGSIKVLLENPIAFFSHRHAALLAGLGTFGTNNMLLTPQYGPRVRFGSVLTAARLPPDPMLEEQLCIRCMRCVDMCPSKALSIGDYPNELTIRRRASCSAELNSAMSRLRDMHKGLPGERRPSCSRDDVSVTGTKDLQSTTRPGTMSGPMAGDRRRPLSESLLAKIG